MFGAQVGGICHYRGASAITTQHGSLINSSTPRGSDHQCQLSQLPEEAEDAEDSSIRASEHRMWFAALLAENDYSFLQGWDLYHIRINQYRTLLSLFKSASYERKNMII